MNTFFLISELDLFLLSLPELRLAPVLLIFILNTRQWQQIVISRLVFSYLRLVPLGVGEGECDGVSLVLLVLDHAAVVVVGAFQRVRHVLQRDAQVDRPIAAVRVEQAHLKIFVYSFFLIIFEPQVWGRRARRGTSPLPAGTSRSPSSRTAHPSPGPESILFKKKKKKNFFIWINSWSSLFYNFVLH